MRIVLARVLLLLAVSVSAQTPKVLDEAVTEAALQLDESLPSGAISAVVGIDSPAEVLSGYVLDGLQAALLRSGKLVLVDRRNLALIDQEENFQLTGRVSDETALSIAQKWGAAFIISGSLTQAGANYRLNLRALEVETARVAALVTVPVKKDRVLAGLLPGAASTPDDWKNKWIYLGARGSFSLGFYENLKGLIDSSVYLSQELRGLGAVEGAVFFSAAVFPFFALQTEAAINADTFELFAQNRALMTVSYTSLTIPLLAKAVWRPSIFMVQAYIGPYLSLPLGQVTVKHGNGQYQADAGVVPGLMVGGGGGIKLGPGVLFAGLRYAADLGPLTMVHNGTQDISRRNKLTFSLGYELGFLNK
jgi:hypothetical protein